MNRKRAYGYMILYCGAFEHGVVNIELFQSIMERDEVKATLADQSFVAF